MKTTELIEFLQKHQYGGATGRPREVYICVGEEIYDTEIEDYSTGDGLVTELYITLAEGKNRMSGECDTCPEYKDYHCEKWCTVIRQTIADMKEDWIPIDFIQEEINKYDREMTDTRDQQIWEMYHERRVALHYLLEHWQKEKEKKNEE